MSDLYYSSPHLFFQRVFESALLRLKRPSVEFSGSSLDKDLLFVELINEPFLKRAAAKVICFYLPQFYAIPENSAWWGDGFTEWTNVKPALPQFGGHYQPHIPGELGYYNLLDPAVQRRQVELAKLYGIGGFCFYFYWFSGKTLLEQPTQNYLADKSLDLPFCLSWPNQNWTRRWDGADNEILMEQKHSPEDDLAFINYVSRYMRDARYIRVYGKPLLLVYRPELFPDPKATALRWRNWCRENGLGEIYLATTQSHTKADPIDCGFDGAVEFPSCVLDEAKNTGLSFNPNFSGAVGDWREFLVRSERYQKPAYTLFPGVCPSWDNTARLKKTARILINTNPRLYQRWLENAIRIAQEEHPNPDDQLVFVNAWNEWAEGCYLEPDERYGYAWLAATRRALELPSRAEQRPERVLIVIHVLDVSALADIVTHLHAWVTPFHLLITTNAGMIGELDLYLKTAGLTERATVLSVENQLLGGSTSGAFLVALQGFVDEEKLVLKLHATPPAAFSDEENRHKKNALMRLLNPENAENILHAFGEKSGLGLVALRKDLCPVSQRQECANELKVFAKKLGVANVDPAQVFFSEDSMFYVRPRAIKNLVTLAKSFGDFLPESGQDPRYSGYSQALNQAFGLAVLASNYYFAASDSPQKRLR